MTRKTLCVDFDGVIHAYSKGWQDGSIYDTVVPGAVEALTELQEKYNVVIYTTRATDRIQNGQAQPNQLPELTDWLQRNQIPYDSIYTGEGKPIAFAYIDDRGVRFDGDWNQTLEELSTFDSWCAVKEAPVKCDLSDVTDGLSIQLTKTLHKRARERDDEFNTQPEQFFFSFYNEVTEKLNNYFPSHKFDVAITRNEGKPVTVTVKEAN